MARMGARKSDYGDWAELRSFLLEIFWSFVSILAALWGIVCLLWKCLCRLLLGGGRETLVKEEQRISPQRECSSARGGEKSIVGGSPAFRVTSLVAPTEIIANAIQNLEIGPSIPSQSSILTLHRFAERAYLIRKPYNCNLGIVAPRKYYAVANGRFPGIYRTWPEVDRQVHGFSGQLYKSFPKRSQATEWLQREMAIGADMHAHRQNVESLGVDDHGHRAFRCPCCDETFCDNEAPS